MSKNITPIFVLGSPRSGTTMIGSYISSSNNVLDMGEYAGFDFAYRVAPNLMKTLPSIYKEKYLEGLQSYSQSFADNLAKEKNCDFFCDSTPWTLLGIDKIKEVSKDSIFILCIRSPQGVIQSLQRSKEEGRSWAGNNTHERLELWKNFYSKAKMIPQNNLIVFNYSHFCKNPNTELFFLNEQLKEKGINPEFLNKESFLISHTNKDKDKRPISAFKNENGEIFLIERNDYNKSKWSKVEEDILNNDDEYKEINSNLSNLKDMPKLHPAIINKRKYVLSKIVNGKITGRQ